MTFKEFCKELLEEYGYIIFQYDSVISFTQTFPDTTCGLGGIGGQAFTDAQIFIFVDQSNRNAIVIGPALRYTALVPYKLLSQVKPIGGEDNEVEEVKWIDIRKLNNYKWAFNHNKIIERIILLKQYIQNDRHKHFS